MKAKGMPEAHSEHPNVTPLIDVVMCLIIFFMLVAKIGVVTGDDKKIELPSSSLGITLPDLGNTLTLNVRTGEVIETDRGSVPLPVVTTLDAETGNLVQVPPLKFNARRGIEVGRDGKPVSPLKELLSKAVKRNPDLKVIVRANADLEYKYLEGVLAVCMEAAVKNVNFATTKPQAQVVTTTQ